MNQPAQSPALGAQTAPMTRKTQNSRLATACNRVCNALLRGVQNRRHARPAGWVSAINEAAATLAKAIGAINDLPAGTEDWIRITPFGRFPNKVGLQVVDQESGEAMVAAFNSLATKFSTLFRGLPVYEGHPDDPQWIKLHPGARAVAVGRVKELQARDDGLWGRLAWNERGTQLVRGDAPAYAAQSPHWGMLPMLGHKTFRPVELWSLGLTNHPNITDTLLGVNEAEPENSSHMKEILIKLLAALGKPAPANATDDQITMAANEALAASPGIVSAANELATLKPKLTTAEASLTTAQASLTTATNEAGTLKTQLAAERAARAEAVVVSAINEGRITAAEKPEWLGKLTANGADFCAVQSELGKKKRAVNTTSQLGDIGSRKSEAAQSQAKIRAINEAVGAKKKETGSEDHLAAFTAVRAEKPELFTAEAE